MRRLFIVILLLVASGAQAQTNDIDINRRECETPLDSIRRLYIPKEVEPSFKGGGINAFPRWIGKRVIYPSSLLRRNIGGTVRVQFSVNTKGRVSDIKIVESPHPALSEEVFQIVRRSPRWKPGRQGMVRRADGVAVEAIKPVKTHIEVSVIFRAPAK